MVAGAVVRLGPELSLGPSEPGCVSEHATAMAAIASARTLATILFLMVISGYR
jgi:hypothetical protein